MSVFKGGPLDSSSDLDHGRKTPPKDGEESRWHNHDDLEPSKGVAVYRFSAAKNAWIFVRYDQVGLRS